jgi:hypothetical protein
MDQLSIAILRAFPLNSEMRINSPFASTSYYPRAWAYADARWLIAVWAAFVRPLK